MLEIIGIKGPLTSKDLFLFISNRNEALYLPLSSLPFNIFLSNLFFFSVLKKLNENSHLLFIY